MPNIYNWTKVRERIARLPEQKTSFQVWFSLDGVTATLDQMCYRNEPSACFCILGHAAVLAWEEGKDLSTTVAETGGDYLGEFRYSYIFYKEGVHWEGLEHLSDKEGALLAIDSYLESLETPYAFR